ncbi:hypothetical protein SCOCK_300011 [Actinacidiphila cocklensis]|uniref:Uncharacterized protein n=1 Tax=Actinacidiphila cocklensis TaxID=887465 RepID=A0A9W4E832_9ACTN|nr:hypothetical protein SCOCK_300011 [Actinacidiphila cocklensis]
MIVVLSCTDEAFGRGTVRVEFPTGDFNLDYWTVTRT